MVRGHGVDSRLFYHLPSPKEMKLEEVVFFFFFVSPSVAKKNFGNFDSHSAVDVRPKPLSEAHDAIFIN